MSDNARPHEADEVSDDVLAIVLKELEKRVTAGLTTTKAIIGAGYAEGDKKAFRSPLDNARLGSIYRTDPEGAWVVTDAALLDEHLRTFPGNVVERPVIVGAEEEVLAVLQEHADHLLDVETGVPQSVVQDALDQSKATGKAAAPGIEFRKPGGTVVVRPDKNAGAAIERMVEAKLLTWDGQRALPAGEQREAS